MSVIVLKRNFYTIEISAKMIIRRKLKVCTLDNPRRQNLKSLTGGLNLSRGLNMIGST